MLDVRLILTVGGWKTLPTRRPNRASVLATFLTPFQHHHQVSTSCIADFFRYERSEHTCSYQ
jgi:hypothetical protein